MFVYDLLGEGGPGLFLDEDAGGGHVVDDSWEMLAATNGAGGRIRGEG